MHATLCFISRHSPSAAYCLLFEHGADWFLPLRVCKLCFVLLKQAQQLGRGRSCTGTHENIHESLKAHTWLPPTSKATEHSLEDLFVPVHVDIFGGML